MTPRIAIAHDYLTQRGGAERVVLALHRAFPEAPIHTTLYDPDLTYPEFRDAEVITSPLNRIGAFRRNHRAALPLLAAAASSIRIDADVVIASSSGWAHGFPTTGKRLVYCHTPARWLYLTDEYLGGGSDAGLKGAVLGALKPGLLRWDRKKAAEADAYLANSSIVKERIRKVYGIEADLLFPPHSVDITQESKPIGGLEHFIGDGGHYLVVSRLMPYKNVDQVIEAFKGLDERLLIVGNGPLLQTLRQQSPDNVRIVANLSDAELAWTYEHCTALIAASYEDFGLTPLEAGAHGKPTIALRAGGYLDSIVEGVNGVFFEEPTAASIRASVRSSGAIEWNQEFMVEYCNQFSEQNFGRRIKSHVQRLLNSVNKYDLRVGWRAD
ncbi:MULTISPECIES: glycosyltransferase [Arthrobacter]|uniref:D-inositol 3-phosphate glycosyltransferase n=2 Tax=Arthrobacter TaxID=1663 RepID=A0ABU9KPB6_9MICC|nr:glycosyltransferase [Arthrobacter sp. YJM1]MDP5227714.1 glycosyltransferase [Arthrobacter sp. YJM1]